jgi:hypothetical protein
MKPHRIDLLLQLSCFARTPSGSSSIAFLQSLSTDEIDQSLGETIHIHNQTIDATDEEDIDRVSWYCNQ